MREAVEFVSVTVVPCEITGYQATPYLGNTTNALIGANPPNRDRWLSGFIIAFLYGP